MLLPPPLKGGLPSREPQILKSLILFVILCEFGANQANGICTGFKRRFHRVYSSSVQNRIRRFEVKPKNERAEGSEKNQCF